MTDPPPAAEPSRPRRRWLKWLGIALGGCAALVGVAVATRWVIGVEIPASRLPALVAELEARGEILDLAALAPPPIPDDQNAAVLLQQAFEEMDRLDTTETAREASAGADAPDPTSAALEAWCEAENGDVEAVFRTHEDALRAYVAARGGALELGEQVLRRPACRFEWTGSSEQDLLAQIFPHFPGLHRIGCLFALRAFIRAVDGDTKGAVQDSERIVQLAQTLRGEPFLISHSTRCVVDAEAVRTMQRGLAVAMPAPDSLRAYSRACAAEAEELTLAHAFRGERAHVYALSRDMMFDGPQEAGPGSSGERDDIQRKVEGVRGSYFTRRFVAALRYEFLLALSPVIDAAALPYPEAVQAWKSFDNVHPKRFRAPQMMARILTDVMLPAYASALERQARTVATLRTAAVGCAIAADITEGAVPPETLVGVAKPLRTDPFTETDLRVTRTDEALVVYSVGVNGQDDGGVFKMQDRYRRTDIKDDIVFRVPLHAGQGNP